MAGRRFCVTAQRLTEFAANDTRRYFLKEGRTAQGRAVQVSRGMDATGDRPVYRKHLYCIFDVSSANAVEPDVIQTPRPAPVIIPPGLVCVRDACVV